MFANIFIKRNKLLCAEFTKYQDASNEVKYLANFKNYSIIQGTVHTCIKRVPETVIFYRACSIVLYIILFCFFFYYLGNHFANRGL